MTGKPTKPVVAGALDFGQVDRQLLDRLGRLDDQQVRTFCDTVEQASLRLDLSYIRDSGETIQIPMVTAPAVPSRRQVRYLGQLCGDLGHLVAKVSEQWLDDPRLQELMPLEAPEVEWLRLSAQAPGHPARRVFHRWDCTLDLSNDCSGAQSRFFEVNSVDVGGVHYAAAAREVMREALRAVGIERFTLEASSGGRDPRSILIDHLRAHARALHRELGYVAIAENQDFTTGITEAASLARFLGDRGIEADCVDARAFEVHRKKGVCFRGRPVDVVYRNIETRDMVALESGRRQLDGLRAAAVAGQLISSPFGDLDHKSLWEVLGSPEFADRFTAAERKLIARHIPWTRLLYERRSEDMTGRTIDLPDYIRSHRAKLVMKPNRSCGGQGVTIGATVSQSQWEGVLRRGLRAPRTWIVQELIPIPQRRGLRMCRGAPSEPLTLYSVYGIFASPTGIGFVARASIGLEGTPNADGPESPEVGFVGRASQRPVVNVMQGGGLLPVLGRPVHR
jgi:hypothetical protein